MPALHWIWKNLDKLGIIGTLLVLTVQSVIIASQTAAIRDQVRIMRQEWDVERQSRPHLQIVVAADDSTLAIFDGGIAWLSTWFELQVWNLNQKGFKLSSINFCGEDRQSAEDYNEVIPAGAMVTKTIMQHVASAYPGWDKVHEFKLNVMVPFVNAMGCNDQAEYLLRVYVTRESNNAHGRPEFSWRGDLSHAKPLQTVSRSRLRRAYAAFFAK